MDLPDGMVFGPYKGDILHSPFQADKHGYAWEIRTARGEKRKFVDAANPNTSNWMRFINGATGRFLKMGPKNEAPKN